MASTDRRDDDDEEKPSTPRIFVDPHISELWDDDGRRYYQCSDCKRETRWFHKSKRSDFHAEGCALR